MMVLLFVVVVVLVLLLVGLESICGCACVVR